MNGGRYKKGAMGGNREVWDTVVAISKAQRREAFGDLRKDTSKGFKKSVDVIV